MAFYNAIVRDKGNKIIARTYINDFSKIPWNFGVYWNKKEIFDYGHGRGLANETKPLTVVMKTEGPGVLEKKRSVTILLKRVTGKVFPVEIRADCTVQDLFTIAVRTFDVPRSAIVLCSGGKQLEVNDKRLLMADLKMMNSSSINVILRLKGGKLRPGSGFGMVELEDSMMNKMDLLKLSEKGDIWKSFTVGLNFLGSCNNPSCIYQEEWDQYHVIKQVGYGNFQLTPDDRLMKCPACDEEPLYGKKYGFTPENFLISYGRALFRFKKVGENDVKSVVIESLGPPPECALFADEDEESQSDYDCIEMISCKPYQSPFECIACGEGIGLKMEEARGPCGHYFHKKCLKEQALSCPACSAEMILVEDMENFVLKISSGCDEGEVGVN